MKVSLIVKSGRCLRGSGRAYKTMGLMMALVTRKEVLFR